MTIKKASWKALLIGRRFVDQQYYFALVRVVTSKITAGTSTAPRTTYCREMSIPIKFIPLVRENMTSLYEAGNILEAVKLGEQVHPQLALIDVVLEDGMQCERQLRSVSPSTRMVVSAYSDRGLASRRCRQGLLPSSTRRIWIQHLCGT